MRFEWDDQKALENFKKHGVTFGEATEVFYDPNALEAEDSEHSFDEQRFFIIGYSTGASYLSFRRTASRHNQDYLGATADTVRKKVYEEQEG